MLKLRTSGGVRCTILDLDFNVLSQWLSFSFETVSRVAEILTVMLKFHVEILGDLGEKQEVRRA